MINRVEGADKGKLMLYALSTCVWCKKMKALLDDNKIAYDYIFVDLLEGDEKTRTMDEMRKCGPDCSFPTLVINDKRCIVGFREDEITRELGL